MVLTGHGDFFCAGADIKEFGSAPEKAPESIARLTEDFHGLVRALHEGPKPTIAAVNGAAAGGGFGLALACDLRVGSTRARFRAAYPRIGLTPDGGVTSLLVRHAGMAAAERILLLNEEIGADEAARLGILHAVTTPEELSARASTWATFIASCDPDAVAETKRLIAASPTRSLAEQLLDERSTIVQASRKAGFKDRIQSFAPRNRGSDAPKTPKKSGSG